MTYSLIDSTSIHAYSIDWQISMWRGLMSRYKPSEESQNQADDDYNDSSLKQLKLEMQTQLKRLSQQFTQCESMLEQHYLIDEKEEMLSSTFQQLMGTIEGLLAILGQLRTQYDQLKEQLVDHQQLKTMLNNHQNIIASLQDSHSSQVANIYQSNSKDQHSLHEQITSLAASNSALDEQLKSTQADLAQSKTLNHSLQTQLDQLTIEKKALQTKTSELQLKYQLITVDLNIDPDRKIIDLQKMQLQYFFYYRNLRTNIIGFLDIKDIMRLQATDKFFYRSIKKEQPKRCYHYFRQMYEKRLTKEMKNAKLYERISELYPTENIKINAFKYLHFRIKPAAYILPYLQEEPLEFARKKEDEEKEREREREKEKGGKFTWRSLFNSEKGIKSEKKDENKFSLSALKNEEEFKTIEGRIESTFKNLLHIKMPEDLQYFSDNMQKQLQQLKRDLSQYRQGKGGQLEWTAQIYCLSRYMYHQINQLFNLLQVIFGQLVKKNKETLQLSQGYQYLTQNELVLRNLIQNLSRDKSNIEKKYLLMENQILKNNLEKEVVNGSWQRLAKRHESLEEKYLALQKEHTSCRQSLDRFIQDRGVVENKLAHIRQELQVLEKLPQKLRRSRKGSLAEEDLALHQFSGN